MRPQGSGRPGVPCGSMEMHISFRRLSIKRVRRNLSDSRNARDVRLLGNKGRIALMPRIYKAQAGAFRYQRPRLRVVLADEHAILRGGLRAMLETEPDLEILGEASGVADAIALARCLQPDVVITDAFADGSGIRAISEIRRECAGVRVIMLTGRTRAESERAAMKAGAHAYIVNDSPIEVLLRAIRAEGPDSDLLPLLPGRSDRQRPTKPREEPPIAEITARERDVLIGVALGYSSKRMAADLGRSIKTIEKHRFKMMHKLGLRNAAAVTRYARDNGLLTADSDAQRLRPASPPLAD
jgi:DNA-binding NarL/FixJ family response regulator